MERHYRAIGEAQYMAEGHNINETAEEFGISHTTVKKDLRYVASIKPKLGAKALENIGLKAKG